LIGGKASRRSVLYY